MSSRVVSSSGWLWGLNNFHFSKVWETKYCISATILKWLFEFAATFLKEVSSKSQSFNMLVFHQKSVVESLKTHLSVKDSLAYQPLLEWVFLFCSGVFFVFISDTHIFFPAASWCDSSTNSSVECVFCPSAWWCNSPETCRRTSTLTFPISLFWLRHCWTPRTRSCWSGHSPASLTSTSTCGVSWWKTWATSTGETSKSEGITVQWIYWNSLNNARFLSNSLYSTLLAHKKEHIRIFAAESFSFLMRKVGDNKCQS